MSDDIKLTKAQKQKVALILSAFVESPKPQNPWEERKTSWRDSAWRVGFTDDNTPRAAIKAVDEVLKRQGESVRNPYPWEEALLRDMADDLARGDPIRDSYGHMDIANHLRRQWLQDSRALDDIHELCNENDMIGNDYELRKGEDKDFDIYEVIGDAQEYRARHIIYALCFYVGIDSDYAQGID